MAREKELQNDGVEWPSVAILIPNWNGRALLESCLPPLVTQSYPNYQIILIDNHSQDDSVAYTQTNYPEIRIIQNEENLGFGKGVNIGLKGQDADIVVLLNNDVSVREGWLEGMIWPMLEDPQIGIVGCKLLYPDGAIQHLGGYVEYPLAYSQHEYWHELDNAEMTGIRDVEYVTGASCAITRQVLNTVGFFDEGFTPFYFEETDYCFRARQAGFRVVVNADAVAIHLESASMEPVRHLQRHAFHKNRLRFVLKHFSATQFLDDFVPAETTRLQGDWSVYDYQLFSHVYLETAVTVPELIPEKDNSQAVNAIQEALLQLRQTSQTQMQQKQAETAWPQAELKRRQTLTEYDFASDTAVVGPLAAVFRRQWNNIAARWSVGHIMQQQNAYNQLVSHMLNELENQTKTNAEAVGLLFRELLQMQHEYAASTQEIQKVIMNLEQQLARIEKLLSE